MGRSLVVAALLIMALVGAGIMAFLVAMNRTDDADRDTLTIEPLHEPVENFYRSRQRAAPRGSWMPLIAADSVATVNGSHADPNDETFELTFSAYAIPDSILYACLGEGRTVCFGLGHNASLGYKRIGWYRAPGMAPAWRWEDAADDYLSFAVSLRQDGGEVIAKLNGSEIGRHPADFRAGPVRFFVGYAPVRLDEVVVATRAGRIATRQQPSYWPYAAYFIASLIVFFLFLLERGVWIALGLDRPGVWIALGYASILIVYAYSPRPLADVPWLALIGAVIGTRALSLPLFASMFDPETFSPRRPAWRDWLPAAAPAPVGAAVFFLVSLNQTSGSRFDLLWFLVAVVAVSALTLVARLRPTAAMACLWWPIVFHVLHFLLKDEAWDVLGGVLGVMTFCGILMTHGVMRGRYVLRPVLSLALILAATDYLLAAGQHEERGDLPAQPERISYHGDEIVWSLQDDTKFDGKNSAGISFGRPAALIGHDVDLSDPFESCARSYVNSFQALVFFQDLFLPNQQNCRAIILFLGRHEQNGALARLLYRKLQASPEPRSLEELYNNTIEGPRWLPGLLRVSSLARWRWRRQMEIETEKYLRAMTETTVARQPQNTLEPTGRQVLEQFIDLGREHGIEMIFAPVPTLHGEFYDPFHAGLMREVARAKGAVFVDLREAVREYDEPFLDPHYLSTRARESIKRELEKVVLPLLGEEPPEAE
ncbi:MAG TPA: hypothetical protein PK961_15170 [bacterium]|nr:hypothetical protein [bacterium]